MICQPADKTIQQVPLASIRKNNLRSRRDPAAYASLKRSIEENGLLYPVLLFPVCGTLEIFDGHGRVQVFEELRRETVPAIVCERELLEGEALQSALVSNIQRENLNPVDSARAIQRLMALTGHNASATAAKLGCSVSSVTKLLSILSLPSDIIERVAAKEIPATAAYELARVSDPAKQAELARDLACGHLTRDAVTQATKQLRRGARRPSRSLVQRALVRLGAGASITVAGKRLDFESFIASCEAAAAKAKRARGQNLSFETFLKVAHDQAQAEG